MLIQPVVLSGGAGTRLWPLSREKYPKQLLSFVGQDTLLQATLPLLSGWSVGPVVLAEQARVALGDPVALALRARAVVVLIGERPGLSSADSLGAYLTFAPRSGLSDADRNCISNIRPEGLPCADAACKLTYLLAGARRLGRSGIALKDDSDRLSDLPSPITTSIPPGEPA